VVLVSIVVVLVFVIDLTFFRVYVIIPGAGCLGPDIVDSRNYRGPRGRRVGYPRRLGKRFPLIGAANLGGEEPENLWRDYLPCDYLLTRYQPQGNQANERQSYSEVWGE